MQNRLRLTTLTLMSSLIAASCGGGGAGTSSPPPASGPSNAERSAAANATAAGNALCNLAALGSYYWEIGDRSGVLASGSTGTGAVTADTQMNIASASKWPFAAYMVQKYGDVAANRPFLNFTSGYSNFNNTLCATNQTVAECNNGAINASESAAATFHYQGGHMQQLAVNSGLGAMGVLALANEVNSYIGSDVGLSYVEPQPPGGARTTARHYAVFLRKLLVGSGSPLQLGALLGSHAVCTQPDVNNCNAASKTAASLPDNFHYALGHWVEDDPAATPSSNFAYSSAGAFGFYPWVDVDRALYGIVAREAASGETQGTGEGYSTLQCGRLIRLAWKTAVAQ